MKVLLIGGTGNISTHVAWALRKRGDSVTVLSSGRNPVPEEYEALTVDRYDGAAFMSAMESRRFDAAIDFIAFNPEHCREAHAALHGRIGQYLFISSATVYEKPPLRLPITEETPLGNRFWDYAQMKQAAEQALLELHCEDFPVTIVRPSHTFGPTWIPSPFSGSDFTVAARILAGRPIVVHDDGQSLWTLTACSDFAQGFVGLVGNARAHGEAFHITHDQVMTWNGICQEIGLALGREPEIVHVPTRIIAEVIDEAEPKLLGDKANHAVFDNTKIKCFVPDFECRKSVREGLRESIGWYLEVERRQHADAEKDALMDRVLEKWQKVAPSGA